jgi:hypothetical protein
MSASTTTILRHGALALLLAAAGSAQANPWTTVGSAGTVDEADTRLVDFMNGEARMLARCSTSATTSHRSKASRA